MRLDKFESETVIFIDIKLTTLNSIKPPSYYDQPSDNLIKLPLRKSPENIPMHHNSPNIYLPWSSKATLFFGFKNGGMPYFLPYANIYQQLRAGQHKNIIEQNITTYIPFYSQQTHILNFSQQKKTMKHSQEHSEFKLVKYSTIPSSKAPKSYVKIIT